MRQNCQVKLSEKLNDINFTIKRRYLNKEYQENVKRVGSKKYFNDCFKKKPGDHIWINKK